MKFVGDFGAKTYKCNYINEYINFFGNIGQGNPLPLTNN